MGSAKGSSRVWHSSKNSRTANIDSVLISMIIFFPGKRISWPVHKNEEVKMNFSLFVIFICNVRRKCFTKPDGWIRRERIGRISPALDVLHHVFRLTPKRIYGIYGKNKCTHPDLFWSAMRAANVHALHIWKLFDTRFDCWEGGEAPSSLLVTRCEGQNTIMEVARTFGKVISLLRSTPTIW